MLKSPLKWAGGKAWLAPKIAEAYRPYRDRRFVEPFCGGLSVTLHVEPERGICNDINPSLIYFYRHVKLNGLSIEAWPTDADTYYAKRAEFNTTPVHTKEHAQLFYYLNRVGFNGLCRFNAKGQFNVPHGGANRKFPEISFEQYQWAFQAITFYNIDFASLPILPSDFVYVDPPYDTPFTTYAPGGFTWADQVRCAERWSMHQGPVIVSNQATARIITLYKELGFTLEFLDAPRRIACNGNRDDAREIYATKNL